MCWVLLDFLANSTYIHIDNFQITYKELTPDCRQYFISANGFIRIFSEQLNNRKFLWRQDDFLIASNQLPFIQKTGS